MISDTGGVSHSEFTWGPGFALAVATACALAQSLPDPAGAAASPADYRWVTHANTALAGAAALYLAYFWLGNERVGRAASLLAALGAVGVPLGLLADAAHGAPLRGAASGFGLYEGTALFSAAAVFVSLAMERTYGSRTAALLIMPAVLLAVFCEMWLIAQDATGRPATPLSAYWILAQRFAASLGYGGLAVAAACGAWLLLRGHGKATRPQADAIVEATAIGAPMLLIGAAMGAAWALSGSGAEALDGTGPILPALLAALLLLAWARRGGADARRLAWNAVAAFAVAAIGVLWLGPWPGAAAG